MVFFKNSNLKNINFYILLFLSLSVFKSLYCQEKVGNSNPERNLDKETIGRKIDEGDTNPYPEQYKDNFGFYSCHFDPYISNKECFNNIIMFNHKKYQVNNFAANKNGDILIQYNEYNNNEEYNSSRLFYGLTKDGSNFFLNQSSYTSEFNINIDEEILEYSDFLNIYKIQDSKSLFVSMKNDNKKNQYLFSINSYNSMVELYDLNNNNNNYQIWSFNKFFNLDEDDYYFPFEYELFELKEKSEYIIAFIPLLVVDEYILDLSFIKKFRFKSFDKYTYEEISSINYEDYLNNIIINTFLLEKSKTIVTLSINKTLSEDEIPEGPVSVENPSIAEEIRVSLQRRAQSDWDNYPPFPIYKFNLKFYDQKLKSLLSTKEVILLSEVFYTYRGEDLFIKSLVLNILDKQFVIFFYYFIYDYHYYFIFELFEINILDYRKSENIIIPKKFGYIKRNIMDFNIRDSPNDFIKINDEKVVFMYMSESINNELVIIIIDVNLLKESLEAKEFSIDLDDYSPTQIKGFGYNGYLLFSATCKEDDYYYNNENSNNYLSMFMAFGYFNGTDNLIDITKFLNKKAHEIKDSFIYFLYDNLKVENNIFGYIPLSAIKIVSFPKELSLYIYDFQNGEEIKLSENSYLPGELQQALNPYFVSDSLFIDSYCIFVHHFTDYEDFDCQYAHDFIIRENISLIKTSEYYYIDYQSYLVADNEFGEGGGNDYVNAQAELTARRLGQKRNLGFFDIYPGRINRVKFKLCHEYCKTCYELDTTNKEQKCTSCLSEYQYDYLYFSNRTEENQKNLCVPKDYYYDRNDEKLSKCNRYSKYYVNSTDNKTICFPDEDEYPCPPSYPNYNKESKECFYCDFERFKNGECTADNLTMNSCTQCDYNCFKLGGCDFNDFNTTNDDFYERIKSGGYLSNYDGGADLKIKNGNGYAFQITTFGNELNNLMENTQRNFSIIDFKDCADLLRSQNELESDEDLVILKYENDNQVSNGNEKSIQYEVYLPNSNTKLDLSVCNDTNITIYVPIELSDKTQKLYDSLKEQGYNIFDKNDRFYHDICTPYKSIDGTDVILTDRVNDIYENNKLECQENCEYSEYLPDSKYLKCDCKVTNEEKIDTKEPEKITAKSVFKSFFDVLKYSNYKVLRCYNLVFRKVTIKENVGSILSNIYFIGYLIAFGIFCYKKTSYLDKEIEKLLQKDDINNIYMNKDNINIFDTNRNNNKEKFDDEFKVKEGEKEIEIIKVKKKPENNNILEINKIKKKNESRNNNNKIIDTIDIKKQNYIKEKDVNTLKDSIFESKNLSSKNMLTNKFTILNQEKMNETSKTPSEKESRMSEKEKEDLTDYELNDLVYCEALELDNRNFLNIYWYLLKREQIILFTFFNWNDFNIFSIKLSKLFLAICSDMAFNVFFFSDDSMHKLYASGGEQGGWVDQFAQMVYSTIISQLLQIFINYLTMTDIHYYQLKELKRNNNINSKKALFVIKCIKYKLIAFYCSTFILFLFFWYTVSAFCAVYANTQGIFVADSYTSFIMGLLYPFALYLAPTALRFLSLKAKEKKNLAILYSLSDKIPFF